MSIVNSEQGSGISAAEETLRLLARLHAPEGLEERVQKKLRNAVVSSAHQAKILGWPAWLRPSGGWMQSAPLRAAFAGAIVAVVVGGGWIVSSRLPAAQPGMAVTTSPRGAAPGGFSAANAKRTPQTLDRPLVAVPAEAPPPKAAPLTKEKADQPATRKPLQAGKLNPAKKLHVATVGSAGTSSDQ
jgi:hypothetical protein